MDAATMTGNKIQACPPEEARSQVILGKGYIVQCAYYRCLAYLDPRGDWRNYHTHELLKDVRWVRLD